MIALLAALLIAHQQPVTGGQWRSLIPSPLYGYRNASEFGAKGDGTTDDTIAIRNALASGSNIKFSSGHTYIVSGSMVVPTAGQRVDVNGATIQRANQVTTTITGTVTSGVTSVLPVTSTTGFKVGQTVTLRQPGAIIAAFPTGPGASYTSGAGLPTCTVSGGGGTGATITPVLDPAGTGFITSYTVTGGSGYYYQPTCTTSGGSGTGAGFVVELGTTDAPNTALNITAVGSGTITVSGTFGATFTSGAVLFTTGDLFSLEGGNNVLSGPGILDNNRTGLVNDWQNTGSVRIYSDSCIVQGLVFNNVPGEAIVDYDSHGTVRDCRFTNLNGNGVHETNGDPFTGTFGYGGNVVDHCYFYGCNLDPTVGHSGGCVCGSSDFIHLKVVNCHMENSLFAGVGDLDSGTDWGFVIAHNSIHGCLQGGIVANPAATNEAAYNYVIQGNEISDCGMGQLYDGIEIRQINSAPNPFISAVSVTGNVVNTQVSLSNGIHLSNVQRASVSGNVVDGFGVSANVGCIIVTSSTTSEGISITGNLCEGNNFGIVTSGSNAITCSGNTCDQQHTYGIDDGGSNIARIFTGNMIVSSTSGVTGAVIGGNCSFTNNDIWLGSGAVTAIQVNNSNNHLSGNRIHSYGTLTNGVVFQASTSGNDISGTRFTGTAPTNYFVYNSTTLTPTSTTLLGAVSMQTQAITLNATPPTIAVGPGQSSSVLISGSTASTSVYLPPTTAMSALVNGGDGYVLHIRGTTSANWTLSNNSGAGGTIGGSANTLGMHSVSASLFVNLDLVYESATTNWDIVSANGATANLLAYTPSLNVAGTASIGTMQGQYSPQTASLTLSNIGFYEFTGTSPAQTATLNATPSTGNIVYIVNASTQSWTIAPNTGQTLNLKVNTAGTLSVVSGNITLPAGCSLTLYTPDGGSTAHWFAS